MKRFVLPLLGCWLLTPALHAQTYLPVDCWVVDQYQVDASPNPHTFTNVGCMESPGAPGTTTEINGTGEKAFRADEVINLKPGFSVTALTGDGNFHAYIQKADFMPVVYHPLATPGEVGKWERFEIGVPLPETVLDQVNTFLTTETGGLNPFNPEQLRIEANFEFLAYPHIADPAFSQTVDGFYYRDFYRQEDAETKADWWVEIPTEHAFRVRFSPSHLGTYRCTVRIFVNGVETHTANPFLFKCVPSASKGPLIYGNEFNSDKRHRYLKYYETDEMFFANGTNIYWDSFYQLHPKDHYKYEEWIPKIKNNGGNYAAISTVPATFGVEWEKLNNYYDRMPNAWELDHVIDLAEQNGIYVNLLTMLHNEFQLYDPGWPAGETREWGNNCYNFINNDLGVNCFAEIDFFSNADAKKYFKYRLRYLLARYGYSVNVPIVELLSEINVAIPAYDEHTGRRSIIKEWFTEMRNYIRTDRSYKYKMVSGSYAQGQQTDQPNQRIFSEADIVLLHFYGTDKPTNFVDRFTDAKDMLNTGPAKNKPLIFDEAGSNVGEQGMLTVEYATDWALHINQWATSFMGCYGAAQIWNWDICVFPQGYEDNFKGLQVFLQDENFANEEYKQERWKNNLIGFNENTKFEAFYLRDDNLTGSDRAIGWLHNTSYWWGNLYNHNPIIKQCVDNDTAGGYWVLGAPKNTDDDYNYKAQRADSVNDGDNDLTTYIGYDLKIDGLRVLTKYKITWYDTRTGLFVFYGGNTDRSNLFGVAKFRIPAILTPGYGDLAFKVERLNERSLMIEDDTAQAEEVQDIKEVEDWAIIYPNPARDLLIIQSTETLDRAEIYAIDGSRVQTITINSTSIQSAIALQAGYYTVILYSKNNKVTSKKLCIVE